MWLKGSRHKCRGSGGLGRERKDQRGPAVSSADPQILTMLTWPGTTTWPVGAARQAVGCGQNPDSWRGAVGWRFPLGVLGGPRR